MAPSAPPLTREEFVSLRDGAKGLMHRIPSEHKARLIELGCCHNVQEIAINRVTDERAENNWSLCVLSAGAADANTAARAALYVQGVLRRDYNLMTD
jgi:hypothetical protein